MGGAVTAWGVCNGIGQVNALYFGPLLVVNAWLVIYTWLQHTDVDVPHFGMDDHTFVPTISSTRGELSIFFITRLAPPTWFITSTRRYHTTTPRWPRLPSRRSTRNYTYM